jgi:hypothetical protein
MEWRIGVIPRPRWSARKGTPQTWRHAALMEMQRERIAAEQEAERQNAAAAAQRLADAAAAKARAAERQPPTDLIADPPREQDKVRLSLMRKLMDVINPWPDCPHAACRRHRRCASRGHDCAGLACREPVSPEAGDEALASLQRDLARRSAQFNSSEGS